eukprot:Platyproteum_vivax@DN6764_c0_g1_i1.p1
MRSVTVMNILLFALLLDLFIVANCVLQSVKGAKNIVDKDRGRLSFIRRVPNKIEPHLEDSEPAPCTMAKDACNGNCLQTLKPPLWVIFNGFSAGADNYKLNQYNGLYKRVFTDNTKDAAEWHAIYCYQGLFRTDDNGRFLACLNNEGSPVPQFKLSVNICDNCHPGVNECWVWQEFGLRSSANTWVQQLTLAHSHTAKLDSVQLVVGGVNNIEANEKIDFESTKVQAVMAGRKRSGCGSEGADNYDTSVNVFEEWRCRFFTNEETFTTYNRQLSSVIPDTPDTTIWLNTSILSKAGLVLGDDAKVTHKQQCQNLNGNSNNPLQCKAISGLMLKETNMDPSKLKKVCSRACDIATIEGVHCVGFLYNASQLQCRFVGRLLEQFELGEHSIVFFKKKCTRKESGLAKSLKLKDAKAWDFALAVTENSEMSDLDESACRESCCTNKMCSGYVYNGEDTNHLCYHSQGTKLMSTTRWVSLQDDLMRPFGDQNYWEPADNWTGGLFDP